MNALEFTDEICGCECSCTIQLNEIEVLKGICTYCINGSHQYDDWENEGGSI